RGETKGGGGCFEGRKWRKREKRVCAGGEVFSGGCAAGTWPEQRGEELQLLG
ncbi:hypothetical protein HAX54_030345, partial [Datura stramonium]|nr:hypothetical protein [Datura stramonium]